MTNWLPDEDESEGFDRLLFSIQCNSKNSIVIIGQVVDVFKIVSVQQIPEATFE